MNRAQRRQAARAGSQVATQARLLTGSWLRWSPPNDLLGTGTLDNGTAEWYWKDKLRACVEREPDGRRRMLLSHADGRDVTLAEITFARATLLGDSDVVILNVPKKREEAVYCQELLHPGEQPSSGLILAR